MTQDRISTAIAVGWLMLLAVMTVMLTTVDDPVKSVVVYFAVWFVSTTVPGILVWRVLAGPTTLVQEIGFGSVVGIALLLLAWLPATLLHEPALMWLWPAGVVVAFAAVPSLRRHWWPRRPPALHTPGRWHAAMILVCGLAFFRLYVFALQLWSLPPKASSAIFQDAWYVLSLAEALGRGLPVDDPAVAGVPLHYHWFANAHVAATQALSGVPAPEVSLHLWLVPMLFTLAFAVAAATERILQGTGEERPAPWWAGPVAVLLAAGIPAAIFLGDSRVPAISSGFVHTSPSGILALVVILAMVGPVLDLLHGRGRGGTWALLLILMVVSTGTKPSLLPVFACGGLLVLVVQWLRTRRFPGVPFALTVIPLVLIPIAAVAVIGSTGGSRLQLFQTLALDSTFGQATGIAVELPGRGGWLAPGLEGASGKVWGVALGLLLLFLLTELPRLIGLVSPLVPTLRSDPGTWWCAGVVGSGWCGLWVLAHPGYSQHYFWRIVIPLGIVLTVTMIVRLLPRPPHWSLAVTAGVGLVGIAVFAVLVAPDPVLLPSSGGEPQPIGIGDRLAPYGVGIAIAVTVILALRLVAARLGWTRVPMVALVAALVCAVGAGSAAYDLGRSARYVLVDLPEPDPKSSRYVSGAEQQAALWLNEHSEADDVVATNVFCVGARYRAGCRHSTFWVAALTGRQLFLGGWAYTEKNLEAYGRGSNVPYQNVASQWPDRLALSLDAVRAPTPAVIAALKERGVQWIFADRRATAVSPRLEEFATLRYKNAEVMIFRLDR